MSREKGHLQLFRMAHFLAHPNRICKIFFKYGQTRTLIGIFYKSSYPHHDELISTSLTNR